MEASIASALRREVIPRMAHIIAFMDEPSKTRSCQT